MTGKAAAKLVSVMRNSDAILDETTPLLTSSPDENNYLSRGDINEDEEAHGGIVYSTDQGEAATLNVIIATLLIGVFVSQADTSIVLATYGKISSEFNDLQSGSWLMTSYMLAQCVAQPVYGKMSDIFGRKRCLQAAYIIFILGTVGSGCGTSMPQLIAARAVQGCGGAGMICMVAIVLTDLVPVHEVALYRSYVNVIQTVGRSCGGALGGYLAQTIGWRWAFLGQGPFVLVALWLVGRKLPRTTKSMPVEDGVGLWAKFKRIDLAGAIAMSLATGFSLIVLDMGGQKVAWNHPLIIGAAATAVTSGIAFVVIEKFWAQEPIFPLRLMTQSSVVGCFMLISLQNLTQTALMVTVPLYWQVIKKASPAEAGLYLVPAILGNTLGGLSTGRWIMKHRRCKLPIVLASIHSMIAFGSLIIFWREDTSSLQCGLIFAGGFGTGIAHSAVFVGLANSVKTEDLAVASSAFYLSGNIGGVIGVSVASAVHQTVLQHRLHDTFQDQPGGDKIVREALKDIGFVQNAGENLRKLMLPAYVASFHAVFYVGLACASLALIIGLLIREHKLGKK